MFQVGDKVFDKAYPSLKGTVLAILPTDENQPEMLTVRYWIPPDEPGFFITGVYEDMLSLPEEVSGLTQRAVDGLPPCTCGEGDAIYPDLHSKECGIFAHH